MAAHVLAIDQGTTSTRAVVYDAGGNVRGSAARELTQPQQILSHSAAELFITRANELGSDIASRGENLSMIAAIRDAIKGPLFRTTFGKSGT